MGLMSVTKPLLYVLQRTVIRLFRLRNLVVLTFILILLYTFKNFKEFDNGNNGNPLKAKLFGHFETQKDYFVPASTKKIDWHNYKQIEYEAHRIGIGEQGKPAKLTEEEKSKITHVYAQNGFNGYLSDKIALNRSLPDIRHPKCKEKKYIESLPTVSVVVPFFNEHWSTLLRTAYSVLNRSPEHLIKEIFLVDDSSTKEFLKDKLNNYVAEHMPKVKVLRLPSRSGLITARLAGAKEATADVIIFLDSHTEANVNWLPPLLEPIALSYKTVVCPFIDVIAYDTFEYRAQDEGARGAFDWEFFYKRLPVLPKDELNMPEPFESPVMAGGLFAISRKYFWELGGYDPGLDIWGGEQYELSFKIWQCGGRMVDAPCSRVGHIYRQFAAFDNPGHGDFVGKNYRRVAEVWMDEYAQYLYDRRPHYRSIDPGNLTEQKAIRKKLKCKPFKWFMTQIAFDLPGRYPFLKVKPYAEGKVQTNTGEFCVDSAENKLTLAPCTARSEQDWIFGMHKDVMMSKRNMCWDLPDSAEKKPVLLYSCHLGGGNQHWKILTETNQIQHFSGRCLDWDPKSREVFIFPCLAKKPTQRWKIDNLDLDLMANWDKLGMRVTGPLPYNEEHE